VGIKCVQIGERVRIVICVDDADGHRGCGACIDSVGHGEVSRREATLGAGGVRRMAVRDGLCARRSTLDDGPAHGETGRVMSLGRLADGNGLHVGHSRAGRTAWTDGPQGQKCGDDGCENQRPSG